MIEMSQTGNNIGKYVQRERKKKGITQEQLAEYTGISWSAISRFETGQSISTTPERQAAPSAFSGRKSG